MKLRLAIIVGTRPEIIKCSSIIQRLQYETWIEYELWNTGQHYDYEMNEIFFKELNIPKPQRNFGMKSDTSPKQLSKLMNLLEDALNQYIPHAVLVIGDTNSTLSAALTARKMNIPVIHVESGCREHINGMFRDESLLELPEETNRIIVDHVSSLLFTSTKFDSEVLLIERALGRIEFVGDIGFEILKSNFEIAKSIPTLERFNLSSKEYVLFTFHRAENVDDKVKLRDIVEAMIESNQKIFFPIHPRTKKKLDYVGFLSKLQNAKNVILTKPLGYFDFLNILNGASAVFTDSGGVQRETYYLKVPCFTLRPCSGWIDLVKYKANTIIGTDKKSIKECLSEDHVFPIIPEDIFGDGTTSQLIIQKLRKWWMSR